MKTRYPLVSILVPALDEAYYIGACIESCLKQSWPSIEIVFFDDGSKDATLDIVAKQYHADQRVKILSSPSNVGKIVGLNCCYDACEGEYIHLLGADDVLHRTCIETCMHEAGEKQLDALYHGLAIVDQHLKSKNISMLDMKFASMGASEAIVSMTSIPSGAWLIHRNVADTIFPIPLEIPYEDIWISAVVKNSRKKTGILHENLYLYRQHKENIFGAIDTSFRKVKFRAERNLRFLNFIISKRLFDLTNAQYEMLMEKARQCKEVMACNGYGEILFADLPLGFKMAIMRNSNKLVFNLKEKIKGWIKK